MAKKDKSNGTPIEFYIPPSSAGGKGPRIPIPINQPNWKYKYPENIKSKPGSSEWLIIGTILITAIAISIVIITKSIYNSPLWIAVIILVVIAGLQIRSAAIRTNNTDNSEDTGIPRPKKKRKKKIPKHRKDYK